MTEHHPRTSLRLPPHRIRLSKGVGEIFKDSKGKVPPYPKLSDKCMQIVLNLHAKQGGIVSGTLLDIVGREDYAKFQDSYYKKKPE